MLVAAARRPLEYSARALNGILSAAVLQARAQPDYPVRVLLGALHCSARRRCKVRLPACGPRVVLGCRRSTAASVCLASGGTCTSRRIFRDPGAVAPRE